MTVLLRASHTHLFRGARLVVDGTLPAGPALVRVLFRDGNEVEAELLEADDGSLALAMPALTTAAGTAIPAKSWRIERRDSEALTVGDRLDGAS